MDKEGSATHVPSANSHSWGLFIPNLVPVAPGSAGKGPSWQAGVVSPLSLPCSLFFYSFGNALLWVRAVPAVPGAGLWLGRAGGPTAPGPPVLFQNQPSLRHSFSSSFPAGSAPKATIIRVGTGPSQIQSCHWCWERLVPAVPSPLLLGTVWGQLMVSALGQGQQHNARGFVSLVMAEMWPQDDTGIMGIAGATASLSRARCWSPR